MTVATAARTKKKQTKQNLIAPPVQEHMLRGNYPTTWDALIGQERAKKILITAARAAKIRGDRLPHCLLESGQPGVGKTTMALLAAQEVGAHVKVASGQIKAMEARLLLGGMADGDVLIIDEIHQLCKTSRGDAEWLLHFLQDGVLVGPLGVEEQPRVTVIGATTDGGRLPETVRDRFPLKPPITGYSVAEATRIAAVMAPRIFQPVLEVPTTANCQAIAEAANSNPRLMKALLETLRDLALVGNIPFRRRGGYDVNIVLGWEGITPDGLNELAQRYLICLLEDFRGEPAGAASIRDRMQEPGGLDIPERILMDKGYISKMKQGRLLTQRGIARARDLLGG